MKIDVRLLIVVVLLCVTAVAEEPPTKLRELIDDSVHWYELYASEESTEPMKPIVALRWPNTVRGSTDGATVIWIKDGRPEAVAAIFTFAARFVHEFNSLSRGTIVARRDDEVVWTPRTPGLQFQAIEGAPEPARTAAGRIRQMKLLAKQFKATFLGWKSDNSQVEPLRMMSTPLYRYKIDKPDKVQDGALFAFASGTDPEALLVLESFGVAGEYQWQYAFVRRTSGGLEGLFRDQIVWAAKKNPKRRDPELNHIAFRQPLDELLEPEDGSTETVESEADP